LMFSSLLIDIATRIGSRSKTIIHREKTNLSSAKTTLLELPIRLLHQETSSLDKMKVDLYREFQRVFAKQKETLQNLANSMELIKPENTLSRGYSIVRLDGKSIKDAKKLKKGNNIEIEMHKGKLLAKVIQCKNK
jgi:exodeoxyribonuclease VII large subunit